MWLSSRHSSGKVRLAEAEIVAPSSNHSDGLLAQAPLMTAANTAIAHGSSNLPAGVRARARQRRPRARCSRVGMDMMLVTVSARVDGLGHNGSRPIRASAPAFDEKLR